MKKYLILVIIRLSQNKYYDDAKKLVIGKMKDKNDGVSNEKLIALNPKVYSFLVGDNSKQKKAKEWIEMLLQQ